MIFMSWYKNFKNVYYKSNYKEMSQLYYKIKQFSSYPELSQIIMLPSVYYLVT
jgi:hypothetical protein